MQERVELLKSEGNDLFREREYLRAKQCYLAGFDLVLASVGVTDADLLFDHARRHDGDARLVLTSLLEKRINSADLVESIDGFETCASRVGGAVVSQVLTMNQEVACLTTGDSSSASKKYDKSSDEYSDAEALVDLMAVLLSNASGAQAAIGDYIMAAQSADRVIKLRSKWAKGYFRKALAFELAGKFDHAALILAAGRRRCGPLTKDALELAGPLRRCELKSQWYRLVQDFYQAVDAKDGASLVSLTTKFMTHIDSILHCSYGSLNDHCCQYPTQAKGEKGLSFPDLHECKPEIGRRVAFSGLCLSEADPSPLRAMYYLRLSIDMFGASSRDELANLEKLAQDEIDYLRYCNFCTGAFVELSLLLEGLGRIDDARQLAQMKCSPWQQPFQRPGFMCKGLKSCSFWESSGFKWISELESRANDVFSELKGLQQKSGWVAVGERHAGDGIVLSQGEWTEVALFGRNSHIGIAPITQSLLMRIAPGAVELCNSGGGEVTFSRLAPRTRISAHCAPSNLRLTAHLGLVVPDLASGKKSGNDAEPRLDLCRIRVGDSWNTWEHGKCLVFDDSFEHEVVNDSDQERIVLLIRFPHPDLGSVGESYKALQKASDFKDDLVMLKAYPPMLGSEFVGFENAMSQGCARCKKHSVVFDHKALGVGRCTNCSTSINAKKK